MSHRSISIGWISSKIWISAIYLKGSHKQSSIWSQSNCLVKSSGLELKCSYTLSCSHINPFKSDLIGIRNEWKLRNVEIGCMWTTKHISWVKYSYNPLINSTDSIIWISYLSQNQIVKLWSYVITLTDCDGNSISKIDAWLCIICYIALIIQCTSRQFIIDNHIPCRRKINLNTIRDINCTSWKLNFIGNCTHLTNIELSRINP